MKQYPLQEEQMLKDIQGLLHIESVNGSAPEEGAPLGRGVGDAIDYVLNLGKSFGFRTKNLDGYCGWVEMGEGEEIIGILVHVDTVSVDDGWSCDPFDGTIRDGKMFGRGACDDKGPAIVSLYAMKAIAESGCQMNKRVRLIVGGDEESGAWKCLDRYKETEELPTCAFSPDAMYPVIYAEKGILRVRLSRALDDGVKPMVLSAGKQANIVPAYACAEIGGKKYEATGIPSHAMEPELGVNALIKLCGQLSEEGYAHPFLDLVKMANVHDLHIDFSDEPSGKLTLNPAVAKVDADHAELRCDIRYPVTFAPETVVEAIRQAVEPLGFAVEMQLNVAPLYVEKDSKLVTTLQKVFHDYTGLDTPPISTGGGTYARAFDNAVAFGIFFPGEVDMCHKVDEFWSVDSMKQNYQIIAGAIAALLQ
ncbi:Sapep family Mn(2+)-dependent dipeptidase [Zongyangia hominis]|uniref:Sapep family Mn(2+)-dependent dipeptidase n=1 Tax=Zongyangia hominis TaxID=2763677 RepID=A0A926IBE1_9FIRM|nr:Sapep family Mn(2+)-dependent dipeptidase [Zongyangia hominis]MBC8571141.1 Sapep family Mn(2+)-dependent dipeptidase [Zongyangia hominis]